ncbi:hypothetical protein B9Q13_01745 [Candidatus Marsarchaeota G2 archaeon ECH_B_SAG-G16]|jgi:2-furoyl-CoA dehydrogenase large subunit|uniref:Aldehyde oxidase/xanthine dehydrogenase a/b hammerhead domain-containing protein n=1 Tax=Candidatus Marsarchaeota G2 archaeon ECH_B_SAG-G16 TaxID=1978167 RepID=A0A2R6C3S7_9ARCH|nr:MAG: hypothetical protein B9Q13_01745 [Candidatus Marsarchaeota G2 archaeon ECH_B_SAG-G16]
MTEQETKWLGKPIKLREDLLPITGKARYIDDLELPNTVYMAYTTSAYAHAKIKKIDPSKALAKPGVLCVITGEELKKHLEPFMQIAEPPAGNLKDYPLAVDKVRYFGEPVAAVVAEDRYTAEDAAELVEVEYEPLPAVVDPEDALKENAPLVHEEIGSNVVWKGIWDLGEVDAAFEQADEVIRERIVFHRYAPIPLEPNGVLAVYDETTDSFIIHSVNQMPMFSLPLICGALKTPPSKFRMLNPPYVGGAFGGKIINYTHITLAALLSKLLKRPVKYIETRSENIASGTHNNERIFYVELAVKRDGKVLGAKMRIIDNCGAYTRYEPAGAVIWSQVTPGIYAVKNIRVEFTQVVTNKGPTGPVRGYSRVQHNFMWERVMDIVAKRLALDPAEVRLKNFIPPEEMPYRGPSHTIYDGGDYPGAFRKLLDALEYQKWRKLQEEYRKQGRLIGIGFSAVIDSGANNFAQVKIINPNFPVSGNSEAAMVMIDQGGTVVAKVGTTDQGQSHETTMAQLVAEVFNMDPSRVVVPRGFDSASNVWAAHSGAYASRSAVLAGTALFLAAQKLKEKVLAIASHLLNENVEALKVENERVVSTKTGRSVSFSQIALVAWSDVVSLPEGMEPGLVSYYVYKPDWKFNKPDSKNRLNNTLTYSYTIHGSVVEVDPETFLVKILKHVVVSDPGVIINPLVVEGQEIGATMHGISAALYESLQYDEKGVLLTPNFWFYTPVGAKEMPDVELLHHITKSTSSLIGVRGIGEGGGGPIGSITNAVEDALEPLGIRINFSHVSGNKLFELWKGLHKR